MYMQACPSPSSIGSHEKSKRKRDRQDFEGESSSVVEAERPIKKIYIKPIEPPVRYNRVIIHSERSLEGSK